MKPRRRRLAALAAAAVSDRVMLALAIKEAADHADEVDFLLKTTAERPASRKSRAGSARKSTENCLKRMVGLD
jgi:hypothetical protein